MILALMMLRGLRGGRPLIGCSIRLQVGDGFLDGSTTWTRWRSTPIRASHASDRVTQHVT
jgi:hypothetical protein